MYKGIAVSEGYAIGKVLKLQETKIDKTKHIITDIDSEIKTFEIAILKTISQLEKLEIESKNKFGEETSKIFEAHQLIANDPEVNNSIKDMIKNDKVNLVFAIDSVVSNFVNLFQMLDDEYLKERAQDLIDVSNRIIKNALNIEIVDLASIKEKVILVAKDLTPSETAQIDINYVLGFVTEIGGKTSHSAIIARLLEIPAIVGVKGILEKLDNDSSIIIDGFNGLILTDFTELIKNEYLSKTLEFKENKKSLETLKNKMSVTKDNYHFELAANIGSSKDLKYVIDNGADGVGLFRTEFLYLDRLSLPTEDEQFNEYKIVLDAMNPKPVVIRTLDIGGDKNLSYLKFDQEMNPFLGVRAIRLCFNELSIFKTQIRALLRASLFGNLKIMFPMIATKEEFIKAKNIVDEVKLDLEKESIKYGKFELGIMIEIPAAALNAEHLAKVVDFFSIGTNDLIQYTFAADRMNEKLEYLYQPFHPSILKLIKMVTKAASDNNIWTGVCGEMASDLLAAPLLIGLGVTELSMTPSQILKIKNVLLNHKVVDLKQISIDVLKLESEEEVKSYLKNYRF
jgi:phosphoenolpyruvate-protein phosphotransferase (PTS system enzyme I)